MPTSLAAYIQSSIFSNFFSNKSNGISFVHVEGRPGQWSSPTEFRPSLKRLNQLKVTQRLKAIPLKANFN